MQRVAFAFALCAVTAVAYLGTRWLLRSPDPAPVAAAAGDLAAPAGLRLVDATDAAGLQVRHFGGVRGNYIAEDVGSGLALGDYDGDGDEDLFVPAINALAAFAGPRTRLVSNVLLRNEGGGRFRDVTDEAGLRFYGVGMGALFADFDGDGRLDLFVTNFGPDLLYRNLGAGRFERVEAPELGGARFSAGAAAGDVDGDGDLDLYIPHYVRFDLRLPPPAPASHELPQPLPPRLRRILSAEDRSFQTPPPYGILPVNFAPEPNTLLRNEGGMHFVDVSQEAGVADPEGRSLQALLADMDRDGDLDLYVCNDVSYNRLFLNRGDGHFDDRSSAAGMLDLRGSMGAALAELDDDGWPDLVISNYSTDTNGLYLSRPLPSGQPTFVQGEELARLTEASYGQVGWGVALPDLDLDGVQDLFLAQGHIRNLAAAPSELGPQADGLFHGLGGAVFEELDWEAVAPGEPRYAVSRGALSADLDQDGDSDLLVLEHGIGLRYWRNDSARRGGSLRVRLRAPGPNVWAVGATIVVRSPGRRQTRYVLAGEGYLSHPGYDKLFALPGGAPAAAIEVVWPGRATPRVYPGPFPAGSRVVLWPDGRVERE